MYRIEVRYKDVTYFGKDLTEELAKKVEEVIEYAVHPDNKTNFMLEQKTGIVYFSYDVIRKSVITLKEIPL